MLTKKGILIIIIIAQFFCTSLWFAGNAILESLNVSKTLSPDAVAIITVAVQFGFITGTLLFAILTLADRFPPSRLFFICATLGAFCNLGLLIDSNTLNFILSIRFLTGFFLAGIYPVGMKIAADYYNKGLGKSLSFLVGALVLGTALPHILNAFPSWSSPQHVIFGTSLLAIVGGLTMVLFVPKGPYSIEKKEFQWNAITTIFKNKKFNKAAIGYFGHMWELYTFWAYVPIIIGFYASLNSVEHFNIPLLSFFVIAIGSLGCVLSGFMSSHFRSKRITLIALSVSGICCLISPLSYSFSPALFLLFLLIWGIAVIADSPIFSSLIAKNAVPKLKGTALTIVNGIGFSITIISIQLVSFLSEIFSIQSLLVPLILGPIIGLLAMRKF